MGRLWEIIKRFFQGTPDGFPLWDYVKQFWNWLNTPYGGDRPWWSSSSSDDVMVSGGATQSDGSEGGSCFVEGTQILMADNTWCSIEKILRGDMVLSFSETEMKFVPRSVLAVHRHEPEDVLKVEIEGLNKEIRATFIHRFYVNGEWIALGALNVGDVVHYADSISGVLVPRKIIRIEHEKNDLALYDLTVEFDENYFVEGILVHNKQADETLAPDDDED